MRLPCTRCFLSFIVTLFCVCFSATGQLPEKRNATVHLKFVNFRGEDIGVGKVVLFQQDNQNSKNLAPQFHNNRASGITFGIYHLRAYKTGFYTADRTVPVYQNQTWAVIQLDPGEENGPFRYTVSGTITGVKDFQGTLWVRAQGLYSGLIADTRAEADGKFQISGVTRGSYVLTTRNGEGVVDARVIKVPSDEKTGETFPVVIMLNR